MVVSLKEEDFGTFNDETVKKYTWSTSSGLTVSVISYGAIIQSIQLPDKTNQIKDLVLGFDDLESYVNRNEPYFGALVGRCANRIGGASFQIDGETYELAKNIGKHSLHGGIVGFSKVNWKSSVENNKVIFSYFSKDMEEGYPGNLVTSVIYEVTDDDVLHMDFLATTDKKTVINLTNHSYFNLAGHDTGAEELYNHRIVINADKITETDADSIPTGNLLDVGGTYYDLRVERRLGDLIADKRFDDNYCVSTYGNKGLNFIARAIHPTTGRYLELYGTQPGVQLYTTNFAPAPNKPAIEGKSGAAYRRHGAFCLETQNYPDAIHHQNFPDPILKPGEVYEHKVLYKFGVEKASTVPSVVPA